MAEPTDAHRPLQRFLRRRTRPREKGWQLPAARMHARLRGAGGAAGARLRRTAPSSRHCAII
eukprot:gene29663-38997_t